MDKDDDSESEVWLQGEQAQESVPEHVEEEEINAIQEEEHEYSTNPDEDREDQGSEGPKEIIAEMETDEYEVIKQGNSKSKLHKYDLEGNMRFRPIIDETSARLARRLVQGKAHDRLHK